MCRFLALGNASHHRINRTRGLLNLFEMKHSTLWSKSSHQRLQLVGLAMHYFSAPRHTSVC